VKVKFSLYGTIYASLNCSSSQLHKNSYVPIKHLL